MIRDWCQGLTNTYFLMKQPSGLVPAELTSRPEAASDVCIEELQRCACSYQPSAMLNLAVLPAALCNNTYTSQAIFNTKRSTITIAINHGDRHD